MNSQPKNEQTKKMPETTFGLIGFFIKNTIKGFIGNFAKKTTFMVIAGASVFFVNTFLMVYFNNGFVPGGNSFLNNTIVMQKVFAGNLVFYFIFFAAIPAIYRGIKKDGIDGYMAKFKEGFKIDFVIFKNILDKTIIKSPRLLFSLSLGILIAAVLSPLYRNPFTAVLLLCGVSGALVRPGKSFLVMAVSIVHKDIDRNFLKKGKKPELIQIMLFLYGFVLVLVPILIIAILKLLMYDWHPGPFDTLWKLLLATGIIGIIIAQVYKNRDVIPNSHLNTYGKFFVILLTFSGVSTFLPLAIHAHDFGWHESGSNIEGLLKNPGASEGIGDSLLAALAALLGVNANFDNLDSKVNEWLNSEIAEQLKASWDLVTTDGVQDLINSLKDLPDWKIDALGGAIDFLTDLSNNIEGGDSTVMAIIKALGTTGTSYAAGKDPATAAMSLACDINKIKQNLLYDLYELIPGVDMSNQRENMNMFHDAANPGETIKNSTNLFIDFIGSLFTGSTTDLPDSMKDGKYGLNLQNAQNALEMTGDFIKDPLGFLQDLFTGTAGNDSQNPTPPATGYGGIGSLANK